MDLRGLKDNDGMNGELYRFYAGKNEKSQSIVWQGKTYEPFAVKADGFEMSAVAQAKPTDINTGNVGGFITALCNRFEQCLGGVVRRRLVYMHYLDAVNFRRWQ